MKDVGVSEPAPSVAAFATVNTNPVDYLSERQKIALAGRWAALKDAELTN